jgi:hypothetical protein
MKRLVSMFAMAGLLLAAPVAMAGEGDFNGDGSVNDADKAILFEALNSTDDGSDQFAAMDLDGDGVISLVDVSKFAAIPQAQ